MSIALIILAAGTSRRMGSVDKLSCDLGGKPLLHHAVAAARASKACPIVLVYGRTKPTIEMDAICPVYAANARLGQTHSLQAGLQTLDTHKDLAGTLVTLGDMPFVTAHHINDVYNKALSNPRDICRPFVGSALGHPVYWPKRYFPELMQLDGDAGAKPIFTHNTVHKIAFETDAVTFDVDTPDRLAQARQRLVSSLS